MSVSADLVITTVNFILIFICIIGNSLVCAVIKKNRHMRIPLNYLLVNLALADTIYATFHVTELVYSHIDTHPEGTAGRVVCLMRNGTLQWIGATSSNFTLVAIAVERYFAVIHPHICSNKGKLTYQKLKVIIYGSWIFAIIMNITEFSRVIYDKAIKSCLYPKQWIKNTAHISWTAYIVISTMLIAGIYSRVVYTLWFKINHDGNVLTTQLQVVLKVRKRVTMMVFTVSAIFGVCWNTDWVLHECCERTRYVIPIAHTFLVFSAAVNPFTYAIISQRFKKEIKKMLCCTSPWSAAAKVHPTKEPQDIETANGHQPADLRNPRSFRYLPNTPGIGNRIELHQLAT